MTGDHSDLEQALEHIDPATLSYQEWLEVGMALHESGLPCELWDSWSMRDPLRYHEGECARKWGGFGDGDCRVKSGTVAKMARDRGWVPESEGPGTALGWDDAIDVSIVDPAWVEPEEMPAPYKDPTRALADYLQALFGADEIVGYVCESFERDGRFIPANKGSYTRTCAEIMRDLERYGSIEKALGGYDHAAGAWVRLNPLTGGGVRNSDVADFRFALVESDSLPKERQLALVRALELPCAAIVDSGNKSLHSIVRVDASDYAQYRERVDRLYEVCRKNGLDVDPQNKNPSRLTRMPGCARGDGFQSLVSGPCGKASWAEWWEWVQETSDDLPEPENLATVWDDMPELSPPLIDGILRQGHKMLLAGPSKAGKSFALIELCVAIAEGGRWMGTWQCAKGRVLYVNLELDPASAMLRFRDVYGALGIEPRGVSNIDVWNLRGRSVPMDRLAPSLIRRALKTRPIAVIIDPIYKVITGDENSASEMARFCNQFDTVAQQVGCAVIYCHHHSKGYQGGKRSMDRASGSGVFARDPDALLDMTGLDLTDDCRREHESRSRMMAATTALDALRPGWRDEAPLEHQGKAEDVVTWAKSVDRELGSAADEAARAASAGYTSWTAWRVEATLREFPTPEPTNLWFQHPVHVPDDTGSLSDLRSEGDAPSPSERRRRGTEKAKSRRREEQADRVRMMRDAIASLREDGISPTRSSVASRISKTEGIEVTDEQIKSWTVNRAKWSPIRVSDDGSNELVDTSDSALDWDGEA